MGNMLVLRINFTRFLLCYLVCFTISLYSLYDHPCFAASTALDGIQIYPVLQRAIPVHSAMPHVTTYPAMIHLDHDQQDLWDTLRDDFTIPHYANHPAVQEKIDWYLQHQEALAHALTRAAPYLYYIKQQVKKHHLPSELVLLPMVESGYDPLVYSNAGAAGLWQMMPKTASGLGLKQNKQYDGRRDLVASTAAALNYLTYLKDFFNGNWLLALAAYNTGEGNVLFAIKRNKLHNRPTDFWSLPLVKQTKDYVPTLLALAAIINDPDRYAVHLPVIRDAPYLAQVNIKKHINLKLAAKLAGIHYKKIVQLNPGVKQTSGPINTLMLPIDNVQQFAERFNQQTSIMLKPTVPPPKISHDALKPLPVSPHFSAFKQLLQDLFPHYIFQPGDMLYTVHQHDSLNKIAKQFHISTTLLIFANQLQHTNLHWQQKLIIPLHAYG